MKSNLVRLASVVALLTLSSEAAAQMIHHDVDVDGVAREFWVYLPSGYDGIAEMPVLMAYHGGGGNGPGMAALTGFNPMADANDFIAVYPQGLQDAYGDPIWNSEGPFDNGVDEVGYTAVVIDALEADYAVDSSRVYTTGYSNGANMAWEIACFLSDRITATAPVAGSMWTWTEGLCTPTRAVPVVSIHGTWDFYNPAGGNPYSMGLIDASEYWAANNGADLDETIVDLPDLAPGDGSRVSLYTWSGGDGCTEVQYYRVERGGHDWPGVWGNMDIDSSTVIWDFVSQWDMAGRIGGTSMTQIGIGDGGANIGTLESPSTPFLGSTIQVDWSDFNGAADGFLLMSLQRADRPLAGGTVYPNFDSLAAKVPVSTAADGTGSATYTLSNPDLLGQTAYLQVVMPDASQSDGWAFSNGLAAAICD